jgi:hypothetical protein
MLHFKTYTCAIVAVAIGCASSASATLVTATFTGTVRTVINPDGLFDSAAVGQSFVARMVFDTDHAWSVYSTADEYRLYGQAPFVISAVATINGVNTSVAANEGEIDGMLPPPGLSAIPHKPIPLLNAEPFVPGNNKDATVPPLPHEPKLHDEPQSATWDVHGKPTAQI